VARWLSIRSLFVLDLLQRFWQVMADGGFITDAVAVIDTSRRTGRRVLAEAGGVRPRRGRGLKGRCLTFAEREEIALGRAAGESMRSIADRLGRSPPTISRELERNLDRQGRYRATAAHALAYGRASRPKPAKLVTNLVLREKVEQLPGTARKRNGPRDSIGSETRRSDARTADELAGRRPGVESGTASWLSYLVAQVQRAGGFDRADQLELDVLGGRLSNSRRPWPRRTGRNWISITSSTPAFRHSCAV